MKNLLFPHAFQKVGWVIFAVGILCGAYIELARFDSSYTLNNVAIIGIVVGALLATCSREKVEDEMTLQMRLDSLLVALYINYGLLIVASLLVYDLEFLNVMVYNMFSVLLIFMVVFRYKVWRAKKGAENEE